MQDRFERKIDYLRLSVTELCNLRCRYCMPEDGICKAPHEMMLTEEEMVTAVRVAASLGVRKVRITGGEPLVKKNILSICRNVSAIPGIETVGITTNGLRLPELGRDLRAAGVDRVNISLDTLDPAKYTHITRIGKLEDAIRGIEAAIDAGFKKIKLNAVLIGGFNDDEIPALTDLTRRWPVDMRFIELMPMNDQEGFGEEAYVPASHVLELLPELEAQPEDGSVARLYRLPGAMGNVGLISPVSAHFCATCSRMRITADGKLKPCLHSPLEYNIRGLDEAAMREQFILATKMKPERHDLLSATSFSQAGRMMNRIGG